MATSPQPFRPQATILSLGERFYDAVEPADFPQAILRFRNDRAAATVGLGALDDEEWIDRFARFRPFEGSLPQPLALRYHGHQFRQYNPDIGDGRGFLYAQLCDDRDRLLDLATKGSGTTPYSRFGDGRLTLKGGVREILATEMLQALGVDTSRSFSLIETGEALDRGDEPSPTRSAVLVRLSHSHVRIGTFQRLAYERDDDAMRRLVDYVWTHLYRDDGGDAPAVRLLDEVVGRTARLAASYMASGFVHGVLNTDNINVTGESFDYGPWRFAPTFDPGFTAAYFDHGGLYAFGRQAEALHWNAMQLAVALRIIADAEPLIAVLETFPDRYAAEVRKAMLWRLGVVTQGDERDAVLVGAIEGALRDSVMPLDAFFHASFGGTLPEDAAFDTARHAITGYATRKPRDHPYWSDPAPCSMLIDEVEAIWSAIEQDDDWTPLEQKVVAIRRMGDALA